ncbi:heterochromatin protein 1-like [Agrilus planipennis]|uniref:Heterochromatin protein 1-like n=1 Tax=Agrilus planipennis TaxID=224129 RepID=A0A1W4XEC7_AGRPL|nr:heterochromatin protein 1-like [Agrilus planipennis]
MGILREPMEVETDSDEDYSLDKIVERRAVNGEVRYFLKWKCTKVDSKVVKRNLECPVIMDSFEKSSKEKKSSKSDTKDKKKAVTNCTTSVVADISTEADKRKVQHSKTCKSHLQSKKVDAEDKSKEKKQKHITSEECLHQEHKSKEEKPPSIKHNQQPDITEASDSTTVITTNKHGSSNLAETSAENEKSPNS